MKRLKIYFIPLFILVLILVYVWFVVLPGKGGKIQNISTPPLSGNFAVGRTYYDRDNNSSPNEFKQGSILVTWVWYPTNSENNHSSSYLPDKWGYQASESHARNLNLRGITQPFSFNKLWSAITFNPPISAKSIEQLHIHAIENAPISNESTSYPVLLFSPGLGNIPTDYTAIIEDIVSHGYIVIGISPSHDFKNQIDSWVSDIDFALNQMSTVNDDQQSPLYHHLNLAEVGAFGHSFGGASTAVASYSDSRIKAGIDMDGTPRGNLSAFNITKPFMILQSDHSIQVPDAPADQLFNSLKTGYMVKIKDSLHRAFSDEVIFPFLEEQRRKLTGTIKGERMIQITSTYALAFFDYYLMGHNSPLLTGPSAEFPEVSLEKSPNFSDVPSN